MFNFNQSLPASSIHYIAFSSEKVVFSESGEISEQTNHYLQVKTFQNRFFIIYIYICWWMWIWCERTTGNGVFYLICLLEEALWWLTDWYFGQKRWFEVKIQNEDFVSYKYAPITTQDINWRTGFTCSTCNVLIGYFDSHTDGTHSLQRINWWASDVMLHSSKSTPIKNPSHFGWPEGV